MKNLAWLAYIFLAVLGFPPPLVAAEFSSPRGYVIIFPDDWVLATQQQNEAVNEATRKLVKNPSAPVMDCTVQSRQTSMPVANVNVVVTPGSPGTAGGQKTIDEYVAMVRKEFESAGMEINLIKAEWVRFGRNPAISVRHDLIVKSARQFTVTQWQGVFPGTRQTYTVTCTASPQQFADVEPVFRQILESFKIDQGTERAFYYGFMVGRVIGLIVIVAGVAGIGLVIYWLAFRGRRGTASEATL